MSESPARPTSAHERTIANLRAIANDSTYHGLSDFDRRELLTAADALAYRSSVGGERPQDTGWAFVTNHTLTAAGAYNTMQWQWVPRPPAAGETRPEAHAPAQAVARDFRERARRKRAHADCVPGSPLAIAAYWLTWCANQIDAALSAVSPAAWRASDAGEQVTIPASAENRKPEVSHSTTASGDTLRALVANMKRIEPLIRSGNYGNQRAIASLVQSWVEVVDAALAGAVSPSQDHP